jgi:hypothetical protein
MEVPIVGLRATATGAQGLCGSRRPTTTIRWGVPQKASKHFASNDDHDPAKKTMSKATISRRVLDTLIRAKLAKMSGCGNVEPLPVAWREPNSNGCNWEIPGWTGDAKTVAACAEQLRDYLRFLREQFDIPEAEAHNGR